MKEFAGVSEIAGIPLEGSGVWLVLAMELPHQKMSGVLDLYGLLNGM